MSQWISLSIIFLSYLFAIAAGIKSFKSLPTIGKLALIWVSISAVFDVIVVTLANLGMNNYLFMNAYDYIGLPLEISIGIATGLLSKSYKKMMLIPFLVLTGFHLFHNIQYGLRIPYPQLSNANSIFQCVFFGALIVKILASSEIDFKKQKYNLLILAGTFIFEATMSIPALFNLITFPPEYRELLSSVQFFSILSGSIGKNILFLIFFLTNQKKLA